LHILNFIVKDIAYFDDPYHGTGQLTARLATDASKVKGATSSRVSVLVQVSFTAIAALVVAFYYSWKMTLLVMAFVPLLVFGGIMRASRFKNFAAKEGKRLLDASAVSSDDCRAFYYFVNAEEIQKHNSLTMNSHQRRPKKA